MLEIKDKLRQLDEAKSLAKFGVISIDRYIVEG